MNSNGGNDNSAGSAGAQDNGGFDFTSGYSRPLAGGAASPGGYRQPSPANDTQQQGGYPGYKPYQPA
jgi:hypothetical protein